MSDATLGKATGPATATPLGDGYQPIKRREPKLVTGYELDHGHPIAADYFEIQKVWREPGTGFEGECQNIEKYLNGLVSSQLMENSDEAAMRWIKKAEKFNNIDQDLPKGVRLRMVSTYVDFLNKMQHLKGENLRYSIDRVIPGQSVPS